MRRRSRDCYTPRELRHVVGKLQPTEQAAREIFGAPKPDEIACHHGVPWKLCRRCSTGKSVPS